MQRDRKISIDVSTNLINQYNFYKLHNKGKNAQCYKLGLAEEGAKISNV